MNISIGQNWRKKNPSWVYSSSSPQKWGSEQLDDDIFQAIQIQTLWKLIMFSLYTELKLNISRLTGEQFSKFQPEMSIKCYHHRVWVIVKARINIFIYSTEISSDSSGYWQLFFWNYSQLLVNLFIMILYNLFVANLERDSYYFRSKHSTMMKNCLLD